MAQASLNLFETPDSAYVPLAERCRPHKLSEIVGHERYLSENAPLRRQLQNNNLPSLILFGPPGVGKTTLARVLAAETGMPSTSLSAINSGKKELKAVIDNARLDRTRGARGHILFIDEIHRYNKAQQDGLLHAVEDGTIILIGATTENPSFEIIPPLLSRCQVLKLEPLSREQLEQIVLRAIERDAIFSGLNITLSGLPALLHAGGGDGRKTLNLLEICMNLAQAENGTVDISGDLVKKAAETQTLRFDKGGEYHYDTISAFIKSVRGSDPDAALYYLARMLEGGEDPLFIARRLIILASEDIGNAEPYALSLATAGFQAVHAIGMPEARIVLAQVTTYLASVPKSNAAYLAISAAQEDVRKFPEEQVPMHLRNAPTGLMKELGYSAGYKYPHDHDNHFVDNTYLPEKLKDTVYYRPTELGREKKLKAWLLALWPKRRKNL